MTVGEKPAKYFNFCERARSRLSSAGDDRIQPKHALEIVTATGIYSCTSANTKENSLFLDFLAARLRGYLFKIKNYTQ